MNEQLLKIGLSETTLNQALEEAISKRLEDGSQCPRPSLHIYSLNGSQLGTVLISVGLESPVFKEAKEGKLISNPIPVAEIKNSGKAALFELVNRDNEVIYRGRVGKSDVEYTNEPEMLINDNNLVKGATLQIENIELKLLG